MGMTPKTEPLCHGRPIPPKFQDSNNDTKISGPAVKPHNIKLCCKGTQVVPIYRELSGGCQIEIPHDNIKKHKKSAPTTAPAFTHLLLTLVLSQDNPIT
jgi:hypothetical protein